MRQTGNSMRWYCHKRHLGFHRAITFYSVLRLHTKIAQSCPCMVLFCGACREVRQLNRVWVVSSVSSSLTRAAIVCRLYAHGDSYVIKYDCIYLNTRFAHNLHLTCVT